MPRARDARPSAPSAAALRGAARRGGSALEPRQIALEGCRWHRRAAAGGWDGPGASRKCRVGALRPGPGGGGIWGWEGGSEPRAPVVLGGALKEEGEGW